MENNDIDILIQKITNEKIHEYIDIEYISTLFNIIDKNKPIPIEYYKKQLVRIPNIIDKNSNIIDKNSNIIDKKSNIIDKRCNTQTCNRKALYVDEYNIYYCWIHSQNNDIY